VALCSSRQFLPERYRSLLEDRHRLLSGGA
jgi:hypothetical protein